MPKLSGADYVAETPIMLAKSQGMVVVAAVGETCEDVPADDLERLLRRGKIRPRDDAAPKKRGKKE